MKTLYQVYRCRCLFKKWK